MIKQDSIKDDNDHDDAYDDNNDDNEHKSKHLYFQINNRNISVLKILTQI